MKIKKNYVIGGVIAFLVLALISATHTHIKNFWEFRFVSSDLIKEAMKEPAGKIVTPKTTAEMAALFEGVTTDAVPRIYVDKLPDDFVPDTVENQTLFMKVFTALALRANEKILKERHALQLLQEKRDLGYEWSPAEMRFFNLMADKYDSSIQRTQSSKIADLMRKVDLIPTSIVVNQAIYFTKWGEQNKESPYAQYYWADNDNYVLQPYTSLVDATDSFMLELNSLSSMFNFHEARDAVGIQFDMLHGPRLTHFLGNYMPEDPDYIYKLLETYETGLIAPLDTAQLERARGNR